jgi:two-component system response regulator GlrR
MASRSLPTVLAVDDDPQILRSWQAMLGTRFALTLIDDPLRARECFEAQPFDAALLDLQMPTMDGLALLTQLRASRPECAAFLISGQATVEAAVTALQLGACDFLLKPIQDAEAIAQRILAAIAARRVSVLPSRGRGPDARSLLVGQSPPIQGIRALLRRIAPAMASTLILGESGTGKELAARELHALSPRSAKPFVALNCAGLSETLIDSELFGHEKGSFTGADARHGGLFEAADGGVLFLDEVGELPANVQAKLLRTLQEGEVRSVGATRTRRVSVWVIAATNRHLPQAIRGGSFRADLYYRLSTFCVEMPPLRARPTDLPLLAAALLERIAVRTGEQVKQLESEALAALEDYLWPGNVRELTNVLEHAAAMTDGEHLNIASLPAHLNTKRRREPGPAALPAGEELPPLAEARARLVMEFERTYLGELLQRTGGNLSEAARRSRVDRTNLRRLLRAHGLRADS